MKKLSKNQSLHERRIDNPKNKYSLVISYKKEKEKVFEVFTLNAREADIQSKAKKIFYRVVREKSWIILHNIVKPYEQDRHNMRSKNGILTNYIKAPSDFHGFEYTYCIA